MESTLPYAALAGIILLAGVFIGSSLRAGSRLQRRLFILFFLLSFVPATAVLITNWAMSRRHLSVLDSPGLMASFESSLRLARLTLEEERAETQALAIRLADRLATLSSPSERGLPDAPERCTYRLVLDRPEGVAIGRDDLPAPPTIDRLDPQAWKAPIREVLEGKPCLVAVVPMGDASGDSALVLARFLDPNLAAGLDAVTQGGSRYRQLRLYYGSLLRGTTLMTLAVLGIVLLAASLLLSRRLARQIGGPLMELAEGTRIVASGNLNHHVTVRALDELDELVGAFNRMTAELKRGREQRLRAERIAAWQGVARRLAHEIKNPLTPIGLAMHRIRSKVEDPAVIECVDAVVKETENLQRLAEEFSQYARLPSPSMERVDLVMLLRGVVDLYSTRRSIAVRWDGWPEKFWIDADPGLMRQVFSNLVKNAVEAMGERGTLTLALHREATTLSVRVGDTGHGLRTPADEIFEPTFTTKETGTGLGLAVARKIVEDHGGQLTAIETSGPGATFEVTLPITKPRSAPSPNDRNAS